MKYPDVRLRRLRSLPALRELMAETHLTTSDFIMPYFVRPGKAVRNPIKSMPGNFQMSVDVLVDECRAAFNDGVKGIMLFGIPSKKDALGTEAYAEDGITQQAIRAVREALPELIVTTDVCLCEYTDHGHCGVLKGDTVDNDATLELLSKTALSHAKAGAHVVAPSDMMDGRVGTIREALNGDSYDDTIIMVHSAKYASSFYGPFRDAAESPPQSGDRRGYQMDSRNAREAIREVKMDLAEGADIVMVKPALAYLDVIQSVKEHCPAPVAAYNVSGEFSMVKAAAEKGWIDEKSAALEILTSIKRAGADLIMTYWAHDAVRWIKEG
jgi:porphobilinogen synthase